MKEFFECRNKTTFASNVETISALLFSFIFALTNYGVKKLSLHINIFVWAFNHLFTRT